MVFSQNALKRVYAYRKVDSIFLKVDGQSIYLGITDENFAAPAYFPTIDSLRKFTDRYIRNSAIEAFTNLRLNTTLKGIEQFLDSAKLVWGGGVPDTLYAYRSSDSIYFKIGVNGTPVFMYIDSTGAGSGGGEALDATLALGNATTRQIEQSTTTSPDNFLGWRGLPSNYATSYGGKVAQSFSGLGWGRVNDVNADLRPNVVATILGYNHNTGGGRDNATEAGFGFRAETHYQLAGVPAFEFHLPEFTTESGTGIRPFSMYTRKTTGYTEMNMMVPSVSYMDYVNQTRTWLSFTDAAAESKIQLAPITGGAGAMGSFVLGGSSHAAVAGANFNLTLSNDGKQPGFQHERSDAIMSTNMDWRFSASGNSVQIHPGGYVYVENTANETPLTVNKGTGFRQIAQFAENSVIKYRLYADQLELSMTAPTVKYSDANGATDERTWKLFADGQDFYGRIYDDAEAVTTDFLRVNRTTTTLNFVEHFKPKLTIGSDADYDIFYRGTDGLVKRLGNGTTGQYLTATTSAAPTWSTPAYSSGQYTPTLTNLTNVAASTAFQCQWTRIGNVVHVSGKVSIDPTSGSSTVQLGMSLPVASGFGGTGELAGTAAVPNIQGLSAAILADNVNGRAEFQFIHTDTGNNTFWFTFTYYVTPP